MSCGGFGANVEMRAKANPEFGEQFNSTDVLFYHALHAAKDNLPLKAGDSVVMTGGIINGKSGNTNIIKIETA